MKRTQSRLRLGLGLAPLAVALCLVLMEAPLPAADVVAPEPADVKTLAVMYFENRSAQGEWQWLSTGIADMLISDLGRSDRLLVVERERLAAMLQELRLVEGGLIDPANAAKVGQVTKVDWVLFGSFEKKGDSLTIEGHILEVKSGQLLRVEQVEGKAEKVQGLEKRLAGQLLARLDVPLTEDERKLLDRKPTDSLDALTYYYQGVEAYELGDYHRALAEFRLAGRQDPRYLEARFQAAEMYSRIEELQHALTEYRRLTDPDRDKALPDFVYYGLGQLLEIRFRDYEAALATYHIITDRRPEFSYSAEELRRVVEDLNERGRKARASDESWGFLSAYADEQRKASKKFALPCLAMMREALCYEALHEDMQAARTYLLLDGFLQVRHIYNPVPGFMDVRGAQWYGVGSKAAEWYQWAVEHNRDSELPLPPYVSATPADGEAAEVKFDATEGWGGPLGARTYVAPRDREIASLSLATTPAGELANPTPASAKWYYREAEVRVYGVGATDLLMRYSYPVGGRSENRSVKAQGVSVTQSPGTSGGRDYRVDMPPGIRGVSVAASLADWRVQFTTRPWQGLSVPQKSEQIASAWSASLPISARISVHPTGMSNLFLDGTLVYDAESLTFDRWSRAPKGFLSVGNLHASCFIHGDKDLDEHTVVAVWPDGQVVEQSWTASAGQTPSIVLNAAGASLERHRVAERGDEPCLFRDRRGTYWLVWVGSEKGPPEASAMAGARSPAAETEPPGKKGIYCCFSPDGRIWSVPRRLSVSSPEDDWAPTLRQDSQGTYWLLWVSHRDPSAPGALWLASSLDGQKWTYPQKVKLPVPKDTDWSQWYGWGLAFFLDPHDRFWVGGSRRLTYSDDRVHWAEPLEIDTLGYGARHSLSCGLAGGLVLVAEDVVGASNPRPPLLYASKDGAQWTKVAELDGGFQPDTEAKLGPKDEEFFGTIQRTCCNVRVIQNSDGMLLMSFSRDSFGGGPLYLGWSRDGRTWGEPLLVEPPLKEGSGGSFESTIAPGGPGRCVVAFASDEGIFALLCQLPYATARQEAALHPPITGPLEAGATEKSVQPTILVLPFQGNEKAEQAALGEALAEVLTIDLARQQGVSVVDRAHLASVLQEQKLSLSGLVDQSAQLRVGKLLGAKLLLAGSFGLVEDKLNVTAHLFDVSTAQLVKSEEASGEVSDWLEVEKPLALALARDLDLKLDEVQVRAIDEKPEVSLHFIRGLGYYYASRHDEAIMEFLNTLFGDEKYVDARYWMARSYLATAEPEHARLELERIVKEYPEHRLASESRGLLGTLPVAAQGSTAEKKP